MNDDAHSGSAFPAACRVRLSHVLIAARGSFLRNLISYAHHDLRTQRRGQPPP
jgi:hypothetical protein